MLFSIQASLLWLAHRSLKCVRTPACCLDDVSTVGCGRVVHVSQVGFSDLSVSGVRRWIVCTHVLHFFPQGKRKEKKIEDYKGHVVFTVWGLLACRSHPDFLSCLRHWWSFYGTVFLVSGFSQRRRPFVSVIVDCADSRGPTHIVTKLFVCLFHFPRFKITLISHQRNLSFQVMIDCLGSFFRCSLLQFLVGFVVYPSLCLTVMQPSTIQHSFATLPPEAKCAKASKEPG